MSELTGEQTATIINWPSFDFQGLLEYVKPLWEYSDCGYWERVSESEYTLHTGGWSDNESIITTMQSNFTWWSLYWYSTTRGGHYVFRDLR